MLSLIARATRWLNQSDKVLIIIHQSPDGDAIASALALALALEKINKKIDIVCVDDIPEPFKFLPGVKNIKKDFFQGDYDCVIVLDCGDLKRTGNMQRVKDYANRKKRLINIDHHPTNDLHKVANLNVIDPSASSTAEIIAKILDCIDIQIDKDIATCLLTGIYTDTGGFKHSNTSRESLNLASQLMLKGARLKLITKNISTYKSVSSLKVWGLVLSRANIHPKYNIVSSIVTQHDLENNNASIEDLAGAVNMIGSVMNANASILFAEMTDNKIRASIRTEKANVDVSRIAKIFGGGGHKKASGFTVEGKILEKQGRWSIMLAD